MKFSFDAYSPAGTEPVAEKHQRLFEAWAAAAGEGDWKLKTTPPVPNRFGGGTSASQSLSFTAGRIRGFITYILRVPGLEAESDSVHIKFTPTSDNYRSLIQDLVPAIIQTVGLKSLTVGDAQFAVPDFPESGSITMPEKRACGGSLYPVFFMSMETARFDWKLTPVQMAERLQGVAEDVRLTGGGIYVIGSRELLPFDKALAVTQAMERALEEKVSRRLGFPNPFALFTKRRRQDG
jgi:hypothetical protein